MDRCQNIYHDLKYNSKTKTVGFLTEDCGEFVSLFPVALVQQELIFFENFVQLRAIAESLVLPGKLYIITGANSGIFLYDSEDLSSADDDSSTIVSAYGRRFKRFIIN